MSEQKATNVFWQAGDVSRTQRQQLLGQRGCTLWFTGLSGSGKSSIAVALERRLHRNGNLCYRLDGDNVRLGINKNLGFSAEDRQENIRRVGEASKLFNDVGVIVMSSFISPYRKDRDAVRELHAQSDMRFVEVYVDCALDVAERRDPKGLYKKARGGEIRGFTGIDDPYEAPLSPEIHLHTDRSTLDEEVETLVDYMRRQRLISA